MDQVQPGHRTQEYYRGRGATKRAIFKAKNAERMNLCEDLDGEDRKENVFRLTTQLMSKNRDAVSVSFVKEDDGRVVVEGDKLMEVWRAHYDKISNKEFAWDENSLTNVSPVCEPSEMISALEVSVAIEKTKQGKYRLALLQELWKKCPKLQAKLLHSIRTLSSVVCVSHRSMLSAWR